MDTPNKNNTVNRFYRTESPKGKRARVLYKRIKRVREKTVVHTQRYTTY
jgi:hypothetical protein